MGIKFKILEKSNPNNPNEEKKYYASIAYGEAINDDVLVKKMAKLCSVNNIDLSTSLLALSCVIQQELKQGKTIKIKGIGTFYPAIKSEGTSDSKKANKSLIKEVSASFRPSSELKTALATADLERVK